MIATEYKNLDSKSDNLSRKEWCLVLELNHVANHIATDHIGSIKLEVMTPTIWKHSRACLYQDQSTTIYSLAGINFPNTFLKKGVLIHITPYVY